MVSTLALLASPKPGVATFLWPWAGLLAVVCVLAVAASAWWLVRRGRRGRDVVWVANTSYLERIPAFVQLMRRYRLLHGALGIAVLAATIAAGGIAARPAHVDVVAEQMRTRDIVLCLDVSGSMAGFDGELFEIFSTLVESFGGERIALSVFNATSRTIFPLTDDYTLVQEQFAEGIDAMRPDPMTLDAADIADTAELAEYLRFTAGTMSSDAGASLVGDGLANCALLFDEQENNARDRSIIVATDNYVSGEEIYTFDQAAALVTSRGVALHGIWADTDPGGFLGYAEGGGRQEMESIIADHGGLFFAADDPDLVPPIVAAVIDDQADELGATTHRSATEAPRTWFLVVAGCVWAVVFLAWRVRE